MKKSYTSILLMEDDDNLGFVLQDNLEMSGYDVELCKDGDAGMIAYLQGNYALCILDVMMPKKDGFTVAEEIRKNDKDTPIIFLTAKSMKVDRIKGFKTGGDDYITKPFSIEELILRVEAVLKRTYRIASKADKQHLFEIGKFTFDYSDMSLVNGKSKHTLTQREASILRLLCLNCNVVLPRENILKTIWGDDDYFMGRSMDVFITKLRKYLKEDPSVQIANVHGVGFKLVVDS